MRDFLTFPDPVNEKASRTVAAVVLVTVAVTLISGWYWLTIPLCYGFWARVLAGPKLSPLGWLAMNVVGPRLGDRRPVPGPPKRFAQGMGAAMSTAALARGGSVSTPPPASCSPCSSPPPAWRRSSAIALAAGCSGC